MYCIKKRYINLDLIKNLTYLIHLCTLFVFKPIWARCYRLVYIFADLSFLVLSGSSGSEVGLREVDAYVELDGIDT